MTTAFGWYCLRDVLISLLLALNPSATAGVRAFIDEYAMGGMRAPEEGELNGVKLAASGAFAFAFASGSSVYALPGLAWPCISHLRIGVYRTHPRLD